MLAWAMIRPICHSLLNSYFAMLKLLSRQAIKALRIPPHGPSPNPLRGPLQTRHLHDALAPPFSGPPSYATIAQRFSTLNPNPISFFRQTAAKEAIEHGRFVDIHDVGGVDPKDYDVLLSDMETIRYTPKFRNSWVYHTLTR
jgi:hypothetical protein